MALKHWSEGNPETNLTKSNNLPGGSFERLISIVQRHYDMRSHACQRGWSCDCSKTDALLSQQDVTWPCSPAGVVTSSCHAAYICSCLELLKSNDLNCQRGQNGSSAPHELLFPEWRIAAGVQGDLSDVDIPVGEARPY